MVEEEASEPFVKTMLLKLFWLKGKGKYFVLFEVVAKDIFVRMFSYIAKSIWSPIHSGSNHITATGV